MSQPTRPQPATFEFETDVIRGRTEREVPLTVRYTYAGTGTPYIAWASLDLSPVEWAVIEDEAAERCDADYADWLADQDELPEFKRAAAHLANLSPERRAELERDWYTP